jgi:hypothetical protein
MQGLLMTILIIGGWIVLIRWKARDEERDAERDRDEDRR